MRSERKEVDTEPFFTINGAVSALQAQASYSLPSMAQWAHCKLKLVSAFLLYNLEHIYASLMQLLYIEHRVISSKFKQQQILRIKRVCWRTILDLRCFGIFDKRPVLEIITITDVLFYKAAKALKLST